MSVNCDLVQNKYSLKKEGTLNTKLKMCNCVVPNEMQV